MSIVYVSEIVFFVSVFKVKRLDWLARPIILIVFRWRHKSILSKRCDFLLSENWEEMRIRLFVWVVNVNPVIFVVNILPDEWLD